jgi:hypothetical protein
MPKFVLDGDARGAVRAVGDLNKKIGETKGELDKTQMSAKAMEKAAANIVKNNEGPLERYNRKIAELAKLVNAGKLSHDQAAAAAQRYQRELNGASQGADRFVSAIGRFAGVTAIIGQVTQALTAMNDAVKQSSQNVVNAVGSLGELQQVATSGQDFQKLFGQTRGFVRRGIFRHDQLGQAADLTFALRNAGYSDQDVEFITRLGENKQVRPENMVKVAEGLKKYQDIFGSKEAGTITDIGQKVFQAAGSTQSDFATVAQASTLFGSEASALGYTDEEALAAWVAIEKGSPGPEEAATRVRGLLTQIAKKKLSKGTLTETINSLVARVRGGEEAIDIIGETRGAAGLNILANDERYADYVRQLGDIRAAPGRDVIGSRVFINDDPQLRAATALQREEGSAAMATEDRFSERRNLANAVYAGRRRRASSSGFLNGAAELAGQYGPVGWFMPDEQVIRGEARGGFQNVSPETADDIRAYLQRQTAVLERIEKNTAEQAKTNENMDKKTPSKLVKGGRQE